MDYLSFSWEKTNPSKILLSPPRGGGKLLKARPLYKRIRVLSMRKIFVVSSLFVIFMFLVACVPQEPLTDEELEAELAKLTPEEREALLTDLEAKEKGALAGQAISSKYAVSPKVVIAPKTQIEGVLEKLCQETDKGNNPLVKGKAKIPASDSFETDHCTADGLSVVEFYCVKDKILSTVINCEEVCFDGACGSAIDVSFCTDTDGGLNHNVAGTVFAEGKTKNDACLETSIGWLESAPPKKATSTYPVSDCTPDSPEVVKAVTYPGSAVVACKVKEFYCDKTQVVSKEIACGNGCSKGACK